MNTEANNFGLKRRLVHACQEAHSHDRLVAGVNTTCVDKKYVLCSASPMGAETHNILPREQKREGEVTSLYMPQEASERVQLKSSFILLF